VEASRILPMASVVSGIYNRHTFNTQRQLTSRKAHQRRGTGYPENCNRGLSEKTVLACHCERITFLLTEPVCHVVRWQARGRIKAVPLRPSSRLQFVRIELQTAAVL
jgi:hypothetical protein